MTTCDVCGRNLTGPDGARLSGLVFTVSVGGDVPEDQANWFAELVRPYEIGREYNVCVPCYLGALGVKPCG